METHLPDCEVLALQLKNVELEARCAHLAKRCRDFKFSYLVLLVAIALLVATYEYLPAFQ